MSSMLFPGLKTIIVAILMSLLGDVWLSITGQAILVYYNHCHVTRIWSRAVS